MTKLQKLIKSRKMTQKELARISGQGVVTVGQSCRKGVQTVRLAKLYAAVLNCNPLDIIEL